MAMREELVVHKVNQSGLRRNMKSTKAKTVQKVMQSSANLADLFPADESNLDYSGVGPPLDHSAPTSSFARRRSIKDRRSSSADSASIEKAIRILKTIRALKEVAKVERSLAVPSPYGSEMRKSDLPISDTWSCVLADSTTRRHFVQSLNNESHVTTSSRQAEEVCTDTV
jgi:hypothetical protein